MIDSGQIEVSKKTLLHISEGIYRTEGSAIKELINNSFDANATKVLISTNYPLFDILTCQDDGDGMQENEFLRIVNGGVGDSPKAYRTSSSRPLIGRLGIGILAIAQICRSFTIISHHEKSKTAFRGKMIFRTDVDKVAKGEQKDSYEIGKWLLEEEMEYDPKKKGVLIFTKDLRQSFIRRFKDNDFSKNSVPLNFSKLIQAFYQNSSRMIKEQGPYMELIWELCNLLPIPYYEESPVRKEISDSISLLQEEGVKLRYNDGFDFIKNKQAELKRYDFNVVFDDIKLYRPIKLPYPIQNKSGNIQDTQLFYFEYDNIVRQRRLQCYGYFLSQEMAIKPRDLKGVQIRIKNVGIGPHDSTFLKYDKIESPRDNWLSGELYIEQGLESALNIDRDSFNENDEHYFILKQQVHDFLNKIVFPTISQHQRKRNKIKKDNNALLYNSYLQERLNNFFKKSMKDFIVYTTDIEKPFIESDTKTINIPVKLTSTNYNMRMESYSSSLVDLLSYFTNKGAEKKQLEAYVKEFSSIIIG